MQLAQATGSGERGFAMAGLLVAIALVSLMLSMAMPTWRTLAQREKEEELLFRGQQYDRAIQLYRKKNAAPGAPSVEALIEGRFLRKKYKDPITNGDFELVGVSQAANAPGVRQPPRGFGQLIGGVKSKSKQKSFRVLNGRSVYSDWQFTYVPWKPGGQPTAPGGPGAPARPGATPGGAGPRGTSGFGTSSGQGPPLPSPR
jgi:type II secretory pathway pseudopilin PulG